MSNRKDDLLYKLENFQFIQDLMDKYSNDTLKYQQKYGFEFYTDGHTAWNNETDAFRHTYAQACATYFHGFWGDVGAWLHERNGNKYMNQSKSEEYMDSWNNRQGKEIARETKRELRLLNKNLTNTQIEDFIAYKVMQRMNSGQLITNLNDKRIQINSKDNLNKQTQNANNTNSVKQTATGYAAKISEKEQADDDNLPSWEKPLEGYDEPNVYYDGKKYTFDGELSDEEINKMNIHEKMEYYTKYLKHYYVKRLKTLAQEKEQRDRLEIIRQQEIQRQKEFEEEYWSPEEIREEVEEYLSWVFTQTARTMGYL